MEYVLVTKDNSVACYHIASLPVIELLWLREPESGLVSEAEGLHSCHSWRQSHADTVYNPSQQNQSTAKPISLFTGMSIVTSTPSFSYNTIWDRHFSCLVFLILSMLSLSESIADHFMTGLNFYCLSLWT